MGKKLYVGNLSYQTTDKDLSDLFSQCGTVDSARVITDRETGRSKGFGFVEMSSDDEANTAINKFNGSEYSGRNLTVNEARPPQPRSGGGGGGYGGGGGGGRRGGGGGRY
jgi:RNA recognition motif-containing protein